MGTGGRRKGRVGQWVAVLLVGLLAGSVMLTPAGAHITTFNHLKTKHFYTKKAANSAFINVGETATNADKLDNLDSTALQQSCAPGSVLAYAYIDGSTLPSVGPTGAFSTVAGAYTCIAGATVMVRKVGVGFYDIDVGANTPCGKMVVLATRAESIGIIRAFTVTSGSDCLIDLRTQDLSGAFNEGVFSVAVLRFS